MLMIYKDLIKKISQEIPKNIVDLGVGRKRGTAPTQAFSDFLTHSEQGDWAEVVFFNALKNAKIPYIPVKYGPCTLNKKTKETIITAKSTASHLILINRKACTINLSGNNTSLTNKSFNFLH